MSPTARYPVRRADPRDEAPLLLLAEETLKPLAGAAGHPERYRREDVLALLERAEVYVAEAPGGPAGFAAVETEGDALCIRCLCVSPAHEAEGVARELIAWVEGLAVSRGLARLCARVPAGDRPSDHLYSGQGFTAAPGADPETVVFTRVLPAREG